MSNFIDLTDKRFGKWRVLTREGIYWNCICDCGIKALINGSNLRTGKSTGCRKCSKRNKVFVGDLTGQKFNKWTVLGKDYSKSQVKCKYKLLRWLCRCDCGYLGLCETNCLVTGKTKGCQKCFFNRLPKGQASFNMILSHYKAGAKRRNLKWLLSDEKFRELCLKPCAYCGVEPFKVKIVKGCKGGFIYNGVDRIDSLIDYVDSNCISCCSVCNWMKSNLSLNDFKNHITKIYNHLIKI